MTDPDRPLQHTDLTPEAVRDRAVADVLADQEAREQVRSRPGRRPATTRARVAALGVFSVLALYLWFAPPAWLEPPAPPPIPQAREEAGLKMAVYLQAQQVERFRREEGRLPDALEEAGEAIGGLHYERLDARTYRIRAVGGGSSVVYLSSDSLRAFAGNADRALGVVP